MGRKMVRMARITNEKTRITTYKKRKACLYKKASEFSTLCGVDTCLIVYGPTRAGEEVVMEPELWPRDESKVRDIIRKYRDKASTSCTKTFTIQESLEKSNSAKMEKVKYCPWDKKLNNYSLSELYAVFVAVGNKIQEAANRNMTFPETSWSNEQLGLCGYNQQFLAQHQLFPMSTIEPNGFSCLPFLNQMTPNTADPASFSNVTELEIAQALMIPNGQNFFYGSCSDGQYGRTFMEPMQWGLGNGVFNNVKQFTEYPSRPAQVNDLEDSGKTPM
ncbi:unnamed protein product [Arabis nemorensis]|uniref:MADS-box domain-containing protein n=1 Tax=Arabis nemorensis TaxID=586526 RepID=A0A565CQZ1_9BRAS|nr:unnamed protein product [Arabis nemorensis]